MHTYSSHSFGHWFPTKRGRILPRHRNADLEIVLVLNGTATWDYEGQPVRVPPRHLSYSWPWQLHGGLNDYVPSVEIYWMSIPLETNPTEPTQQVAFHSWLGLTHEENSRITYSLLELPYPVIKASDTVCQLVIEMVNTRPADNRVIRNLQGRSRYLRLLAEIEAQIHAGPATQPPLPMARARVEEFLPELSSRCDEEWTLNTMADACGLGRTHFCRWVKELTGDTPVQYLNRQRVKSAQALMVRRNLSITDVAFACGFQSSQYFATVFRTFTGSTPGAWRETSLSDVSSTG